MRELCHRCHGELPVRSADSRHDDDAAILFCPHCGAPQLLLPEHMLPQVPVVVGTTGAIPPPRLAGQGVNQIDWPAALQAATLVSVVSGILLLVGLRFSAAGFLSTVWTMGAAVVAMGLYMRSRPQAWMDGRVGLRIGLVTGVVMIAAMGVTLAATGVIMRFGTHSLGGLDAEISQSFDAMRAQMTLRMQEQGQSTEIEQKVIGFMGSPEARAGVVLFYLFLSGFFVLLLSAGGGAFAGMMRRAQASRPGQRQGS